MKKIFLIIEREFLTRVKKKSFIITTVLVPLFFVGLMAAPFLIQSIKDTGHKNIVVIDRSGLAPQALENTDDMTFLFQPDASPDSLKAVFKQENYYAVAAIGPLAGNSPPSVDLYAFKQINLDVQRYVEQGLEKAVEQHKLAAYQIAGLDTILAAVKTRIPAKTFVWGDDGEEKASHREINMIISYILGFIMYMFIFMFGSLVMRGVIEEKNSRIVEVIVSSAKPFQLMMGKIVGIASVGLLQFLIWIVLTLALSTIVPLFFEGSAADMTQTIAATTGNGVSPQVMDNALSVDFKAMFESVPLIPILVSFLFFFLLGYLLYAALFAAVGSAVENEADTQQLTIPITVPLIVGLLLMLHTFQYPDSTISVWASIIPFTSPMVMMARIPFGVPAWQVILSLALLFATFVAVAWLAGKIYRTGILMYGKKPSLKEMWKWLRYKN